MAILRASQHSANENSASPNQPAIQKGAVLSSTNEKPVLTHSAIQTDDSLKANQSISDSPILPHSKSPDGKMRYKCGIISVVNYDIFLKMC